MLKAPNRALGCKVPVDRLDTDIGARQIPDPYRDAFALPLANTFDLVFDLLVELLQLLDVLVGGFPVTAAIHLQ